jgi:hypothetical protein
MDGLSGLNHQMNPLELSELSDRLGFDLHKGKWKLFAADRTEPDQVALINMPQ